VVNDKHFVALGWLKELSSIEDLLAAVYLIFFALIAGGAFALMNQNLRGSASLASGQTRGSRPRRHPEAPEPGDEVLYVDLSRERLEELYQQAS
jgi:hypothetical protein